VQYGNASDPPSINFTSTNRDSCSTRKNSDLIIIRTPILQHRIAAHQQLSSSRHLISFLSSSSSYTLIRTSNRRVIRVHMNLSRLNYHLTQPLAAFLGDSAITHHSARSTRRRHQTSITAKLLPKRKAVNIANFALHKQRRVIANSRKSSKASLPSYPQPNPQARLTKPEFLHRAHV